LTANVLSQPFRYKLVEITIRKSQLVEDCLLNQSDLELQQILLAYSSIFSFLLLTTLLNMPTDVTRGMLRFEELISIAMHKDAMAALAEHNHDLARTILNCGNAHLGTILDDKGDRYLDTILDVLTSLSVLSVNIISLALCHASSISFGISS
jgi:hypothetical protein